MLVAVEPRTEERAYERKEGELTFMNLNVNLVARLQSIRLHADILSRF